MKAAVTLAEQNNQPFTGQIHYRWHFTDAPKTLPRDVITVDNIQAVRDLLTEYLVRYPNQIWVSFDRLDVELEWIGLLYRPEQGTLLPTGEGPSTSGSAALTVALASSAGTGQTRDRPLPTGQPATKKFKSAPRKTKRTTLFFATSTTASGSTAGKRPSHHVPGKPRSTPKSTISVAPPSATKTPKVIFLVPTDSGQEIV